MEYKIISQDNIEPHELFAVISEYCESNTNYINGKYELNTTEKNLPVEITTSDFNNWWFLVHCHKIENTYFFTINRYE